MSTSSATERGSSLASPPPPGPADGPFPTATDEDDASGLGGPRGIKAYLRFANNVFVEGSLVTAAGLVLPVQLNLSAPGVDSAGLAAWVADGRVSVAAVPCDKCRALEYHRAEGSRPLPCLVRSVSNRSDGENCVLCKVKRQSCCAELRAPVSDEEEEEPVVRRSTRTAAARAKERLAEEELEASALKDAVQMAKLMESWSGKVAGLSAARRAAMVGDVSTASAASLDESC